MELARMSLLGKARSRPDLVKKIIARLKTDGWSRTLDSVSAKLDTPLRLGYSCSGTVVEVGEGVTGLRPGDRVACAGAGYATHAELNYVPRNLTARIPPSVGFEDASFATLGAIAMQSVRQADVRVGDRVVVLGLGLLGTLVVQILKAAGCQVLGSDPDARRCALAQQLGADMTVSDGVVDAAASFSLGHGADAVIIAAATTSNLPLEDAGHVARMKGRIVALGLVGLNVPREAFYRKELDLRLSLSYGPGRYDPAYEEGGHDYPIGYVRWTEQRNMESFLELVAAGKVTPGKLISHRFAIGEALEAYDLLESGREPYLGIVLTYPERAIATETMSVMSPASVEPASGVEAGLIGAGSFAKGTLIPELRRLGGVRFVGVCTATGVAADVVKKKHEFAYATTDRNRLLADPAINTVFIATRHDTHARFACEALAAGKHVFVEKPLCVRPEELDSIAAALAASPGRCLTVGFNRRFSAHTIAIREVFASRTAPMMISYRVNAGYVPKDSWLHDPDVGGGRVVGEACHFIDWCESVTGSVPLTVQAESIASADARVVEEDTFVVTIRYEDGSVATVQYVSVGPAALGKERVEVFADGRAAVLDDYVTTTFHGLKRSPVRTRDKGFSGELSAFLQAIRGGGAPPIPYASLIRTTRVTFAIRESLRRGTVVPVPTVADSLV
jgi:predicted dehydrogenase/threonine dehydrogenase-like Zn-dependent dehydrogenase